MYILFKLDGMIKMSIFVKNTNESAVGITFAYAQIKEKIRNGYYEL